MSNENDKTGPGEEPSPVPDERLLRRSTTDKVIGGVAGGLGRYLGLDPVLLRIAFVLLAVFGGSGVLLYTIGWIAIPEEKPTDSVGGPPATSQGNAAVVFGIVLVALGAFLLVRELIPDVNRFIGPVVLIGIGAALLLGRRK